MSVMYMLRATPRRRIGDVDRESCRRGMRWLLVEDERPLAAAREEALREANWVVDHTDDGREGLRKGLASQYDVIVLDIMLPGLNGYDVLKHLRENRIWTPVLMLTAKD